VQRLRVFLFEVFVGMLLNLTASLFPRETVIAITKWGWFLILIHGTYLALSTSRVARLASAPWLRQGRIRVFSYAVVAIVGAGLAVLYWLSINKIYDKLLLAKSAASTPPLITGGLNFPWLTFGMTTVDNEGNINGVGLAIITRDSKPRTGILSPIPLHDFSANILMPVAVAADGGYRCCPIAAIGMVPLWRNQAVRTPIMLTFARNQLVIEARCEALNGHWNLAAILNRNGSSLSVDEGIVGSFTSGDGEQSSMSFFEGMRDGTITTIDRSVFGSPLLVNKELLLSNGVPLMTHDQMETIRCPQHIH